jgi:hypothetical protein
MPARIDRPSTTGGGAIASDSFPIVQTDTGTSPTASSPADILTLTSPVMDVNGDSGADVVSWNYKAEYDAGNSSTAITVNFSNGPAQKVTLTGNATFTLSNPASGGAYVIKLVQDGTGSRTVTWPAAVKWPSGTAPTLSTTATKIDLINLYYDGTSYYGSSALGY